MTSTVNRFHSNRAPLGYDGTEELQLGYVAYKSAATVQCYHVNMVKNL